jgi:hypothetical protein
MSPALAVPTAMLGSGLVAVGVEHQRRVWHPGFATAALGFALATAKIEASSRVWPAGYAAADKAEGAVSIARDRVTPVRIRLGPGSVAAP